MGLVPVVQGSCLVPVMVCDLALRICSECAAHPWRGGLKADPWRGGLKANPWRGGHSGLRRGAARSGLRVTRSCTRTRTRGAEETLDCGACDAVGVVVQSASLSLRRLHCGRYAVRVVVAAQSASLSLRRPRRGRSAVGVVGAAPSAPWALRRPRRGCCAVGVVQNRRLNLKTFQKLKTQNEKELLNSIRASI